MEHAVFMYLGICVYVCICMCICMYVHIYAYMYIATINKKEYMNFKGNKEEYIGQLKGGKEKRKWCNYIVVPKNRKSDALEKSGRIQW